MNNKKNGFTLIEVFLVLAILSVIAIIGINFYQQRLQAIKVDKTVMQMQNLLQASLAFRVKNSRWPGVNAPLNKSGIDELREAQLIPTDSEKSSWNAVYTVGEPISASSVAPNDSMLSISLAIPTAYNNANKIAEMIASRLPVSTAANNVVTTYVSPLVLADGGGTNNDEDHIFKNMNLLDAGIQKTIDKPTCPQMPSGSPYEYKPKVEFALSSFQAAQTTSGSSKILDKIEFKSEDNPANSNQWNIRFWITAGKSEQGSSGKGFAVSYCEKVLKSSASAKSTVRF